MQETDEECPDTACYDEEQPRRDLDHDVVGFGQGKCEVVHQPFPMTNCQRRESGREETYHYLSPPGAYAEDHGSRVFH